jgi:acetyltransferase-like isoleucine patch superfamily enzyme
MVYWQKRLGSLGAGATISKDVRIYCPKQVKLGPGVVLNDFVHVWGAGGVSIGAQSMVAAHVAITSQTHDLEAANRNILYRDTSIMAPVTIGDNVWIGSNASILPGVTIGDGAVVGAGAVVTRDVPARAVVAGVPARVLRIV